MKKGASQKQTQQRTATHSKAITRTIQEPPALLHGHDNVNHHPRGS